MRLTFIFYTILFSTALSAQCPDRGVLWKRIVYLRDSSFVAPAAQLTELSSRLNDIRKCPGPYDSIYALLLLRIGALTAIQKDFPKAISYTHQSIDMIYGNASNSYVNCKHLIKSYNNLRIFYDSLRLQDRSGEAADSCISVALRLNAGYEYAIPLIYLRTQSLFEAGDYYQCINYALIGENLIKANGYQLENVSYYRIWRINSLVFLNRFEEAERLLSASIDEARRVGYYKYLGALNCSMILIAGKRKDSNAALNYAKQALYYDDKTKNNDGCSSTLNNLGYNMYFQNLRQYDKALLCFRKALRFNSPNHSISILCNMANVFVLKNNYDSANYYFQRAFDIIKPGSNEQVLLKDYHTVLLDKNAAQYVFELILDKAGAYQHKYKNLGHEEDIESAIRIYRTADKLLNEIKTTQSAMQSKLFWRTQARRLYEDAIAACYVKNNYADAFYFFEKSRAVLLQDQMTELNNISDADLLQQAGLKRRIELLESSINGNPVSAEASSIMRKELAAANQELDKIYQLIKKQNPLYYQSFYDTTTISVGDVKKNVLKDHAGLIELFSGDSADYSILITKDKVYFRRLVKADFENTIDLYIKYISNAGLLNTRFAAYTAAANHLYRLIFSANTLPEGRIIVSPDGLYFPFESLITDMTLRPVYFLTNHTVSYTYSARYLMNDFAFKQNGEPVGNFMGVAPVKYPADTRLTQLDGSIASLKKISAYLGSAENQVFNTATKHNFQRKFGDYSIIQLYTHASDTSVRKEPVIYFSDSALYMSELIPEKKPATQLIVLSACETGKGTLYQGEGVFSFNRAFASLGIPSSVTNLWSIDNVSTYQLTELFYKYLAKEEPLDIALQHAKLEYLRTAEGENLLPYYWAAPILVGKTDAIQLKQHFPWKYIMFAMALTGLLVLAWRKITQSKTASLTQDTIQTAP